MRLIQKVVVLAVFVLLSLCGSTDAYIERFELNPPEPTPDDTVEIRIYGMWSDPCYDSAVSEITVTGDTIKVDINHYSMECVEACVAVLWPYQVLDTIFPVAAGDYTIWFHEDLVYVCDSTVDNWHSWESYFPLSIPGDPCENCLAGDSNTDGAVTISDVTHAISHIFTGGPGSGCPAASDANHDGSISIGDVMATIRHIFSAEDLGECALE